MVRFGALLLGVVLTFFGFGAAWNAREVARKDEQYDAIGSRRGWLDAEPAGWKVSVVRLSWGIVGIIGLALVGAGLLL
ncbi:hypothetical protein [Halobellus rubicundus]|uniref:Uncharacterized protein n=1 Tax=Halobellus rubicundus TaxID=2996466 RepID=A0ABD5MIE6_9EURY